MMAPVPRKRSGSVPAVDRAAGILLALGNGQGEATLTQLAGHLRIHKSTAYIIQAALARSARTWPRARARTWRGSGGSREKR
jgi:DNA-binding IclR family transcriptional regulator